MNFLFPSRMNSVLLLAAFLISLCSCNNNDHAADETSSRDKQKEAIQKLEKQLHASASLNTTLGKTAAQEYFKYAAAYPDDSLAADYLFKGAEISTAIQNYSDALHAYQQIVRTYPRFLYARESMYLQGFLLDNHLNDDAKAKVVYEQFLATYKTGPYVDDAKAAIANLGKTDEELIRQFEKMNEGK